MKIAENVKIKILLSSNLPPEREDARPGCWQSRIVL
jgi:hypothetical protein